MTYFGGNGVGTLEPERVRVRPGGGNEGRASARTAELERFIAMVEAADGPLVIACGIGGDAFWLIWDAAAAENRTLAPYLTLLNNIRRRHPALQQLRNEHPNLRAALSWLSADPGRIEDGLVVTFVLALAFVLALRFVRREGLIQTVRAMRVKIVLHQHDLLHLRIHLIAQIANYCRVVQTCAPLFDLHLPPRSQWLKQHK